ncbi:multifunctional CCA addition/repair protein [Glaciecola petra]|uniref:Multifunctional CCA addition/repair protein n=1 Tax=Glaciecola petra TaxID=3075602 RepID=A0ABU2ZSW5_9ALTE|nr:multifunctional CCA addition/repair protein [Aestuariibacter sp. P117]MDT0595728.1 multifunctional CCA addition/repair protein [Aestuariibacter sp. P117]
MTQAIKTYLVGGAVRDELLGIASQDKDYVVVGASAKHMLDQGYLAVGKDFPVFLHPKSKHEYALARIERKIDKGYTGFSVEAGAQVSLEDDLARRDLTINAIAKDENGSLIDPFNGQNDLNNKILRHVTDAFSEDPVRVLRIARFRARYGKNWQIHPDTHELIKQIKAKGELEYLVPERIWKETEKALNEQQAHVFFETLEELDVLDVLFPELAVMRNIPQPPEHHPEGDVFVHTLLVLKRACDLGFSAATRFAALCHDFGKPISHAKQGNLHNHEEAGVPIVEAFCERLRIPNKLKDLGMLTSKNHLLSHRIFELQAKTLYRMIIEDFSAVKQPERFLQFLQACQCDAQGRGETLVNRPYPQRDFGEYLLAELQKFDAKSAVQEAIEKGKNGPLIGDWVRQRTIACIKVAKASYIRPE